MLYTSGLNRGKTRRMPPINRQLRDREEWERYRLQITELAAQEMRILIERESYGKTDWATWWNERPLGDIPAYAINNEGSIDTFRLRMRLQEICKVRRQRLETLRSCMVYRAPGSQGPDLPHIPASVLDPTNLREIHPPRRNELATAASMSMV
jgi:hypothetical protein